MARRAIEVGLRFAGDAAALWRTCGPAVAARWVGSVAAHLPACLRTGSLSAADDAMGEGPFTARLGGARARLVGPGVIGGIREIWARDSYLGEGFLRISNADVVVDLGANVGHFSTLALAHGPQVRVVAVEANPEFRDPFEGNLEVNGWQGRADLLNVFIGGTTATQRTMRLRPEVSAIPMWSQEDFIRRVETYKPYRWFGKPEPSTLQRADRTCSVARCATRS